MFASIPYTSADGEPADPEQADAILYALSFCTHCAEAKTFLEELDVSFAMTQLDTLDPDLRRPALQALRRIYGDRVIYPVLEIDGEMTFGYDRDIWRDRLRSVLSQQ